MVSSFITDIGIADLINFTVSQHVKNTEGKEVHKIEIRLRKYSVFLKAQLGMKCQFCSVRFLGTSFQQSDVNF